MAIHCLNTLLEIVDEELVDEELVDEELEEGEREQDYLFWGVLLMWVIYFSVCIPCLVNIL